MDQWINRVSGGCDYDSPDGKFLRLMLMTMMIVLAGMDVWA